MDGSLFNYGFKSIKSRISGYDEHATSAGDKAVEKPQTTTDLQQDILAYVENECSPAETVGTVVASESFNDVEQQDSNNAVMQYGELHNLKAASTAQIQHEVAPDRAQDHTDRNTPSQSAVPQSVVKYRPIKPIPPFHGRICRTPPPAESHWNIPMDWPPPKPSLRTAATDAAIIPPEGAPFHVHVQAYALRWGAWASSIDDFDRREQVLKFVTTEMRKAWETAIKEGIYVKSIVAADDNSDYAVPQSKKVRKRAVSPSREAAPFATDGKPEAPITNGELEAVGITMEMINARVANGNLDEAEQLLKAKTEEKGGLLVKSDWTKHVYAANPADRDLLMFCLYTTQQCRKEVGKFTILMGRFKRENQKKNTQIRIDVANRRAEQHLALAVELIHQQPNTPQVDDGEQPDSEDIDQASVDERDQDSNDESKTGHAGDEDQVEMVKHNLSKLAHEICNLKLPGDAQHVLELFRTNRLHPSNFSEQGSLNVDHPYWTRVKRQLGLILTLLLDRVAALRQLRALQHKHSDNPSQIIRSRKEVEFTEYHLFEAHEDLVALLHEDQDEARSETGTVDGIESSNTQPISAERTGEAQHDSTRLRLSEPSQENSNFSVNRPVTVSNSLSRTQYDVRPPAVYKNYAGDVQHNSNTAGPSSYDSPESTAAVRPSTAPSTPPKATIEQSSPMAPRKNSNPAQAHPYSACPSSEYDRAMVKQYVDRIWVPWLVENGIQHAQDQISGWPQIEELLKDRGYGPQLLQQARGTYYNKLTAWIQQYRSQFTQPVEPTMPTDEEIRLSIPPHGIKGDDLMTLFYKRTGQERLDELRTAIQRLTSFDQEHELYFAKPLTTIQPHMLTKRPASPAKSHQFSASGPVPAVPSTTPHAQPVQQRTQFSSYATTPSAHQGLPDSKLPKSTFHDPQPVRKPVKLKLNPPKQTEDYIPLEDPDYEQQDASDPYSHNEINTIGNFSFRHLPESTLAQRRRTEDEVDQHIQTFSGKRKPWGQYITFPDPEYLDHIVAHGVWNANKDGEYAPGFEWFYAGDDPPTGLWDSLVPNGNHYELSDRASKGKKRTRSVSVAGDAIGKKAKKEKRKVAEEDEDWQP